MISLGSLALIRATSSLPSSSPGVIAPALIASSRRSNRKSALRAALSGPWQAKQFSARMGRTSRLYSSRGRSVANAGSEQIGRAAINRTYTPRGPGTRDGLFRKRASCLYDVRLS